jgi:hypothetical protein
MTQEEKEQVAREPGYYWVTYEDVRIILYYEGSNYWKAPIGDGMCSDNELTGINENKIVEDGNQ